MNFTSLFYTSSLYVCDKLIYVAFYLFDMLHLRKARSVPSNLFCIVVEIFANCFLFVKLSINQPQVDQTAKLAPKEVV